MMTLKGHRVIARRDCAYCGDKEAVLITTRHKVSQRATRRFCSPRCSRKGTGCSPQRRQKALNRAIELILAAAPHGPVALEEAAKLVYHRGYNTGTHIGKKLGMTIERRRWVRLLAAKRAQKEQKAA